MKNLFLTLAFLFSAIVTGQKTKDSNAKTESSKPIIERSRTSEQNDSIAKNNVNSVMKKSLNNESYFKKYEDNSQVQYNVNQLNRSNTMFNNTTNGSHISPAGKVVNPLPGGQQGPGTMQVQVPIFKTK
ncbi:hypothetical protein F3J23_02580 [Chryseobacterium sp. Tr-659]|uniref:hypothetical protein n=1 Tax=Chryseobacterium sp. Tr-659 TaxID=2608340 RepID=UPI001423E443|nr:hypothetical protein [Chryseobacterium sp. Tr-659]NIF04315.1 hypothetical protein [Chryseobacterium sp. Tr-659]